MRDDFQNRLIPLSSQEGDERIEAEYFSMNTPAANPTHFSAECPVEAQVDGWEGQTEVSVSLLDDVAVCDCRSLRHSYSPIETIKRFL